MAIHPGRPRSSALRRGRVSEPGRAYLLTLVTRHRQRIFEDLTCARIVIRALSHCHEQGRGQSLCHVLMPDHLHWLLVLGKNETLSSLMHSFKTYTSRAVNLQRGTPGMPVWQVGYHDHALRADEDVKALARYVVANPLRAGLVSDIGQYAHWDAAWLADEAYGTSDLGL